MADDDVTVGEMLTALWNGPIEIAFSFLLAIAVVSADIGSYLFSRPTYEFILGVGGWKLASAYAFCAIGIVVTANGERLGVVMAAVPLGIYALYLVWIALDSGPDFGNPYLTVDPRWPWVAFGLPTVVLLPLLSPRVMRHTSTNAAA